MSRYVLVHGAWHGSWCWEKVVPLLSQAGHQVETLDLPGHGQDRTPIHEITLATYTKRVCETLDAQAEPVILVGHSMGGAMGRVSVDATAFAHRATQAMVIVTNFGPGSAGAEGRSTRTEQIWQALQPYADGVYVNFLAEEGEQRVHEAYPSATYARLAALKNRYDPTNFFHMNQNIKPTMQ